jgi:urea transport system substrate-binding protein
VPLGGTDFSSIIAEIQQAKPDIIINTLNGDSNVSFFKQMAAAGLTPDKLPVMSFSIAEPEAKAMGPACSPAATPAGTISRASTRPHQRRLRRRVQSQIRRRLGGRRPDGPWLCRCLYLGRRGEKAGTFDPTSAQCRGRAPQDTTARGVGFRR